MMPPCRRPPHPSDPESAARLWLPLLHYIERLGLSSDDLLGPCGMERAQLEDYGQRIPLRAGISLLRRATALHPDPLLPALAGYSVERASFGLLAMFVAAHENRRDALCTTTRMTPLALDGLTVATRDHQGETTFYVTLDGAPPVDPYLAEYLIGLVLGTQRRVVDLTMLRVHLAHPARTTPSRYRNAFGGPVLFEQEHTGVVFPTRQDPPFKHADPALEALLGRQASAQLAELPKGAGYRGRVLARLRLEKMLGEMSMVKVADELHLNERTLRRRLDAEGVTFASLLDDVRRERTMALIEDRQRSLYRVAEDSGFQSPGAFRRAFRRWTGESPRAYRERLSAR